MVQQNCSPTRIFGGEFQQHLFLGCSIMSVRATVGWNDQQSEVEVSLVQDLCEATSDRPKIYWDENLNRKTTTAADPGFVEPNVGAPVYLRLEDFEFAGLVQSYEQTNNDGGNPTFRVVLVDPRVILQGTQVIIGDYAGDVYLTPNVINAYGLAESYGQICPLRTILGGYFGSPAGGFGGASINDNGMRWNVIREAVSVLTSAIPAQINSFSSYGRLVYIGNQTPGYGAMKSDFIDTAVAVNFPNITPYQTFYMVDLSEIPFAPAYYRISGTSISLLDLINTVCEDAGADYYIELLPVRMGSSIMKIIKVRIVLRSSQPQVGRIAEFVENAGNVIAKSIGQELRNEVTTQFIVGGNIESVFQADSELIDADSLVVPYWGLDENNDIIPTEYDSNGKLNFTVSLTNLNSLLYSPLGIDEATITEYELQAALTGQDAWIAVAAGLPSDLGDQLQIAGILDPHRVLDTLNKVGFPHHLIVPGRKAGAGTVNFDDLTNESNKLKDIETIYNFVLGFARDFYGKKFVIRVPYTCARIDDENFRTESSEVPSDGGWTEYATVIGLPNPEFTDIFKDDSGRIGPFVRFNDAATRIEISNVPEDDYILVNDDLYLRANIVYDYYVYEDYSTRFNPHAVIELASPVLERLEETAFHRTKEFANKFFTVINNARTALGIPGAVPAPDMNDILKNSGNSLLHLGITSTFTIPDAAAVPIRSNVLTYGPWVAQGPVGLTNIEKDDGLVPWEYGSVASMNLAGNEKVSYGVTYMQVGELGSVTVPGYPTIPLGAELLAEGFSLLETRNTLTNQPSELTSGNRTEKGKWDATSGSPPSISPKNGDYYTISQSGTTTVDGRSEWSYGNTIVYVNGRWEERPKNSSVFLTSTTTGWLGSFGPNITSINVEIGEQGLTTTYSMRTYTPKFGRFSKRNADRLQEYTDIINSITKRARIQALTEFKIQTNRTANANRIISNRLGNPFSAFAASPPGVLVGQTVTTEAGSKSTAVHVIKHNELVTELEKYESKAFMSLDGLLRPVSKDGSGGLPKFTSFNLGNLKNISVRPEPPLDAYTPPTISQEELDPWQDGHDIDILGRGDEVPDNLSIPLDDYAEDYRGLALKGPILLQQPGYDLQGKPIPNLADTEGAASSGEFNSYGLKDSFLTDYLSKPQTWPVAPVDLRYDRNRGVWVAPQPYRIVKCQLTEDPDGDTAEALIFDGNNVENENGEILLKTITVNLIDSYQAPREGDTVLAEYDSVHCKYNVIEAPSKQSSNDGGLLLGICNSPSVSISNRKYDQVSVSRCTDLDGTLSVPQVVDTVQLLKHHVTESDQLISHFHQHDLREGDMIAYMAFEASVSGNNQTKYVALSDYSREQSHFFARAKNNSTGDDFPDFEAEYTRPDGETETITVKNRLQQPILEGACCYIYRHKFLPSSIINEYWLMQVLFSPVCVVTDINIYTYGSNIPGYESQNAGANLNFPYSSIAASASINFAVRDLTIYVESAHKRNDVATAQTYLGLIIDTDVQTRCCSSGVSSTSYPGVSNRNYDIVGSAYQIGVDPFYILNPCSQQQENWVQETNNQCDITDVQYAE